MKIIDDKCENRIDFDELEIGDVFKSQSDIICMKIRINGSDDYAVMLGTGRTFSMDRHTFVIPYEAELHTHIK